MESKVWLAYTTDYEYDKMLRGVSKESQFELGTIDDKKTWFYPLESSERRRINAFGLTLIKELTQTELESWQNYESAFKAFTSNMIDIEDDKKTVEDFCRSPRLKNLELIKVREQFSENYLAAFDAQHKSEVEIYKRAKADLAPFVQVLKECLGKSVNVAYAKTQEKNENKPLPLKPDRIFDETIKRNKEKYYSEKKELYPSGEVKSIVPYFKNERHGFVKNFDKDGNCTNGTLWYYGYKTEDYNYTAYKNRLSESEWERVFYGNFGRGNRSLFARCDEVLNENYALQGFMPLECHFKAHEIKENDDNIIFKRRCEPDAGNVRNYLAAGFFVNAFTPEEINLKRDECQFFKSGVLVAAKPEAVKKCNLPLDRRFFSLTDAMSVLTNGVDALLVNKQREISGEPAGENVDDLIKLRAAENVAKAIQKNSSNPAPAQKPKIPVKKATKATNSINTK